MAQVRVQDAPTVAPSTTTPFDYDNNRATPQDFGGAVGAAEQRTGGQLEQAGGDLAQAALVRQERFNQVVTTNAYNQYLDAATNLTYGDPKNPTQKGFYQTAGQDAMQAFDPTRQALEDARQKILGTLQNPAQKLEFEQASKRVQAFTVESMGRHYDQQSKVWGANTNAATADIQAKLVGAQWNDPVAFTNGVHDIRTAYVRESQSLNGDTLTPDLQSAALLKADSKAITSRALEWGNTDPSGAMQWLENGTMPNEDPSKPDVPVKSRLDPLQYQAMKQHFQSKSNTAVASHAVDAAMGTPLSGPVPQMIVQQAQTAGVQPIVALTWAARESNLGAAADDPGNSHTGVYQMGPNEFAAAGGKPEERGDVAAQVRVGVSSIPRTMAVASAALGREATPFEGYLTHQQGASGGPTLLKADPNANVVDALAPAYGGNRAQAIAAVVGNSGTTNMTAGQFVGIQRVKYQDAEASVGGIPQPNTAAPPPSADTESTAMDRLLRDPALADNPEALERATRLLQTRFAVVRQARQEASSQAGDQIITQLLKNPLQVTDEAIANNGALTGEQKWNLSRMRQEALTHGDKQATEYGPGIYEMLKQVTSQPTMGINELGQPAPGQMQAPALTDPTQLWGKVQTGVLTIAGVQKLSEIMQGSKTLDGQNDNRMLTQFLDSAKQQISKNGAFGGSLRDPQGEKMFVDFLTSALPAFSAGRASGKTAAELLNSKSPDYIGKSIPQFVRPMSEWLKDLHNENGEDAGASAAPASDLKTKEAVLSAYTNKQIGYDAAVKMLEGFGIPHAAPAAPAKYPGSE